MKCTCGTSRNVTSYEIMLKGVPSPNTEVPSLHISDYHWHRLPVTKFQTYITHNGTYTHAVCLLCPVSTAVDQLTFKVS